MSIGILCLVTEDPIQAAELAEQLQTMNLARRELESEMQDSAQLQAEAALSQAGWNVKTAIVMLKKHLSAEAALALLETCQGNVRLALKSS